MKRSRARRSGAKRAAPKARNPFALAARRRRAGIEPSTRAYRRRPKHQPPGEETEGEA
ncbi:MAG TPA: hypothetical protein VH184_01895 [Dongiaceae bacterium]|jgi:hypothetical protein|nr:hypothetical protein [Dongiaceae bacterium]